jgi:alkanesulfonate monooxygenase SsuD/methylene tetrahydromethanopterin reductase-like flavin-dependent oxidoreductase (luciferase family)
VQKPHPPIVVGGHSRPAWRRAVSKGNGWYGFALDPDAARANVEGLRRTAKEIERPAGLGELHVTVTPSVPLEADALRRYEDAGVHRLVPIAQGRSAEALLAFVEATARALIR